MSALTSKPRTVLLAALVAIGVAVPLAPPAAAGTASAPPTTASRLTPGDEVTGAPAGAASSVRAAKRPPVTGGRKGLVVTRLAKQGRSTGQYAEPGAVTTDAKGRVIVAANDWNFLVVLRYRANGRLDTSFGTKGVVRLRLGKNEVTASDVAVDRKGRIVVAATSNAYAHNPQARVVRLTAKGKADKKFAKKGVYSKKNVRAGALLLDKNRIVLVGRSTRPSGAWITRLGAKGKVTKSFGKNGVVRLSKYGAEENERVGTGAVDAVVDAQGRIVVHLSVFRGIGQPSEFGLARLTPAGRLDTTFYGGGWHTQQYHAPEGGDLGVTAAGLARTRDGGFVTAGGTDGRFTLFRYAADGAPLGIAATRSVSKHMDERAVAVATDAKGRIVSTGSATQRLGLTRHSAAFAPTAGFGTGGAVLRKVPGFRELRVTDLTIDRKGRVVVVATGHPKKFSAKPAILVLRYTNKGRPHAAWGR